jgi:twitching motility protein PilT
MIDYINENYKKHIITIEDPIEYVHAHKKSIIEQKEV